VVFYFALWVIFIPFLASAAWLFLERLCQSSYGLRSSADDALFAAPFGVVFSLIITVPVSLVVYIIVSVFPAAFIRGPWIVGLASLLSIIGSAWACFIVRDSGFTGGELRAALVGAFAGLVAALTSVLLLGKRHLERIRPQA
jgi:hypothetical protein